MRTPTAAVDGGTGRDDLTRVQRRTGPSGKVHGAQRVLVDLHRLGQGLLVPAVALARRVAALSTGGRGGDGYHGDVTTMQSSKQNTSPNSDQETVP